MRLFRWRRFSVFDDNLSIHGPSWSQWFFGFQCEWAWKDKPTGVQMPMIWLALGPWDATIFLPFITTYREPT